MRNKAILAATVLVSTLVAIPALAQSDDVCLRLYDVRSTRVHDNSTLVATDRQRNQYTVHMSGEFLAQFADEHIYDFNVGIVRAVIEMV